MKKALYYAIRTGGAYNPVIAVTREKQHRWYGREVRGDMPTNGVLTDLSGKFEHVESAIAMRESIAKLSDSYDEVRKLLAQESSKLYQRERRAMEHLLKGEDPGPIPAVTSVHKVWIASSNQEWVASGARRSLNTSSHTSQLAGACARAAEDINPKAGGFIIVRPEPEEVVR
jgi:acetoin utilization deacetylase AcuC-like enzyme